jgi:predicted 2-oxoglutarate/Fe(II)-dependent dioxygenase YbiX
LIFVIAAPFYVETFLDAATCARVRALMDRGAVEPAEILAEGAALDEDVRRAASIDVGPQAVGEIEQRLDAVRDDVARHFGLTLSDREGVNFLRYAAGGFYLPHVDRAELESWPDAACRQVALVIFLNGSAPVPGPGEFSGGELCLIDGRVDVVPRAGMLVAFDAGALHEVLPVRHGTRDVIVDWFY